MKDFRTWLTEEASADEWLEQYTHQNLDKWPSSDDLQALLRDYPYGGGTIYRGINVRNEEAYDKLVAQVKEGRFTTSGITSWSRSQSEAKIFALTRPTYFLNRDLMHDESEKSKNRDYMIGFRGIVLKTTIKPGVGIDVNKSKFAHEDEIILPPGAYVATIAQTLVPYKHSITDRQKAETELMSLKPGKLSDDDIERKKLSYILHHFENFSDGVREHIFKLLSTNLSKAGVTIRVTEGNDWHKEHRMEVHVSFPIGLLTYYGVLSPEKRPTIDQKCSALVRKVAKAISDSLTEHKWNIADVDIWKPHWFDMIYQRADTDAQAQYFKLVNKKIGQAYKGLETKVSAINKMTDPRQHRQAIDDYAATVMRLIKNI